MNQTQKLKTIISILKDHQTALDSLQRQIDTIHKIMYDKPRKMAKTGTESV